VIRGAFAAALTPLTAGGASLDEPAFAPYVEFLAAGGVDGIRVAWPSGRVDTIGAIDANQIVTIQEGSGVIRKTPIVTKR